MTTKTSKKNQKPIEADIAFKYKCPAENCYGEHWLSLKETQVKYFRIVCECGFVFRPKQIKNIKIIYEKVKSKQKHITDITDTISVDLLNKCVKILSGYGFGLDESKELIKKSYKSCETNDIKTLIETSLKTFGDNKNE